MKVSIPLFFVLADFATVLAAPFGGEFARDAKDDNVFARQPFGGEFARDEANVFARDAKDDNVFARQPTGEFARK
jgi:hypothetical protein